MSSPASDIRLRQLVAQARERLAGAPVTETLATLPATPEALARFIDHTLLKPTATEDQIRQLCAEAIQFGFATVCVNPVWVSLCVEILTNQPVGVCTVIGFPLGATSTPAKVFEAESCARDGADELDMVIQIGPLQAGDYVRVHDDIAAVLGPAHRLGATVKVIIEAAYLTETEKIAACVVAQAAGADYVKTSTGFGPGGATVADVTLMRRVVGPATGVKAAGGIRTLADARAMLAAGASRLGASAGVSILHELDAAS